MINKRYNPDRLYIKEAAAVLEIDSSLVSRLLKDGRLTKYTDDQNRNYTTEADVRDYLTSRLPSGYVATLSEDHLTML